MNTQRKEQYNQYLQGLKALQKFIRICQKNDIYYYAASCYIGNAYMGNSIHIDTNGVQIDTLFNVKRTESEEGLNYVYIDFDGVEIKLIIE